MTRRKLHLPLHSRRGSAGVSFLVALLVLGLGVGVYLYLGNQRKKADATIARKAPTEVVPEVPVATPAPAVAVAPTPVTPPEPEPAAIPEVPLDLETITRTPAYWPKTITLNQAFTIPLVVNGQTAGQAKIPAKTAVRLVRIVGQQVELEHLQQRFLAAVSATDLVARATALSHTAPTGSTTTPAPALVPVAMTRTTPAPVSATPTAKPATPESDHFHKLALEVMADVHDKFWMRQAQRYAKSVGSKDPDMVWGAGVMFSAVVGAARHEPGKYKPVLQDFYEGLNGYWDSKAKVPGYEPAPTSGNGNDKYYDDNAWMVLTFFEAYELTHNSRYRRRAEETLDFVLSGWDTKALGGGIWWHEAHEKKAKGKNTCANAPAAVGCLLSAKYSSGQAAVKQLDWAEKIVEWTTKNLQLKNALYADSIGLDGGLNEASLTYNSALMLRAYLGLYRATKKPEHLAEAKRIGRAADGLLSRETGAYRDPVKWAHLMVESDLELHRVTGEEYLLERARKNGEHYYQTWKTNPPDDLISAGSIARTLWLLADAETAVGRKFWEAADAGKTR